MNTYLSISIGSTPATARPLLASTDPDIVRGAIRAILGKVDASAASGEVAGREPQQPNADRAASSSSNSSPRQP